MDTWLAVLFTAIVSPVVVILIGLFLEYKTGIFVRNKKEIRVSMVSSTELVSPKNKDISDKLEIKYDGRDVKSLVSLVLGVANTGNVPITSADFEEPLRIKFGVNILEYSISSPTSSGPVPKLKKNNPVDSPDTSTLSLQIEPLLINKRESFVVSVLLPEFNEENLKVSGRIVGTKILVDHWEAKERESLFLNIINPTALLILFALSALLATFFTIYGATR